MSDIATKCDTCGNETTALFQYQTEYFLGDICVDCHRDWNEWQEKEWQKFVSTRQKTVKK